MLCDVLVSLLAGVTPLRLQGLILIRHLLTPVMKKVQWIIKAIRQVDNPPLPGTLPAMSWSRRDCRAEMPATAPVGCSRRPTLRTSRLQLQCAGI